ncbi:LacI family DNA-binding transcriptional regulator [Mycolicibacterium sp. 120266]|uniref:LacI family DNA-binding transcriptional regulator n=1 Tax=Mycolicibacterium sp. 120266 TaxID=3090601 RepID=UPI00299CFE2B|nr:LacI family DNA-binding transcriptional regulator [Mycolicibacterium sp. 120266]MDX1875219.1 LacI family DNA-binding transcriptional regulator [Mycolicibacterium sp. 120266]
MVTMKDVAKAAGVSQASVSYAYSGSPRVSETQRHHIFTVAAALGYTGPNIAGSFLRSGRIGAVGVLVPGPLATAVEDPSTALLLKGIVEVGELADVALTLLPVPRTAAPDTTARPATPAVLRGLVDGVVLHCLPNDHEVVQAIRTRGLPAVAIDSPRLPHLPYVTADHRQGGTDQMNHVLAQGHRRIAVLTDRIGDRHFPGCRSLAQVPTVAETYLAERFTGYRDALHAHAADDADVTIIEAADIDMASGMAAAAELIACARPTAVVTTSDVHAAATLKVLRGQGIEVPRDVSVIGFDDAPIADLLGLTTIRQPLEDKGRTAAQMLLDVIGGQQRRRSVKPVELIVRTTTGPAAG